MYKKPCMFPNSKLKSEKYQFQSNFMINKYKYKRSFLNICIFIKRYIDHVLYTNMY